MWIWAGAVLLPTLPTLPHSPFLVHIWSFLGIRAYFFWLTSLISHPSKATKSICPRIGEEESLWLLSQLLLQPFVLITANPSMSPIVSFHLCNNCESFFTVLCCIHVDVGLSLCICFIQQSAVLGWIGYLCLGDKAGLRYSHAGAWTHSAYLPHPPLPPFRLWTSLLILICTATPPWLMASRLALKACPPSYVPVLLNWTSSHEITSQAEIWALNLALLWSQTEESHGQMRDATSVLLVKSNRWHQPSEQLDRCYHSCIHQILPIIHSRSTITAALLAFVIIEHF